MTNEYREPPPPTRSEFIALEERLTALEERKPKRPFVLTLMHTLVSGFVVLAASIYAFGWMYDHLPANGTRVSLDIVCGILLATSVVTVICSLAAVDNRPGLNSPWRKGEE